MESSRFVATVSQVNRRIALMVKNDAALSDIYVKGEVSNFVHHYKSGHLYFTLKEGSGEPNSNSALKCVMFAADTDKLGFIPEDGDNIIARGRIQVYERDGVYQLYAASLERGEEDESDGLFASFVRLKEKLEKEGVFSNSRPLPSYPKKICLITAKDGAALQDMLSVFARRYPVMEVLLIPALVQGKSAPRSLKKALVKAGGSGADLIILARGGGSAEDLWAFNDEELARAVYASPVPVVSAVGHETDFTLTDFAADLRAPAPSAAAELVTPDLSELVPALDHLLVNLKRRISARLDKRARDFDYLTREINLRIKNILLYKQRELDSAETLINALNPDKVFSRGFAAVYGKDGGIVKDSETVGIGDELNIRLAKGKLKVSVIEKGELNDEQENQN